MSRFAVLIAVVALLTGCGHGRVSIRHGTQPTTLVTGSSVSVPQTPVDATVGQPVATRQGGVVTVYTVESPAAFAESGFVIAAADIGACAPAATTPTTARAVVLPGVSPRFFRLQLSDGTVQEAQIPGAKQPALPEAALTPGQCARGWVSFHIPEQQRPAWVILRSLSFIRWRIAAT